MQSEEHSHRLIGQKNAEKVCEDVSQLELSAHPGALRNPRGNESEMPQSTTPQALAPNWKLNKLKALILIVLFWVVSFEVAWQLRLDFAGIAFRSSTWGSWTVLLCSVVTVIVLSGFSGLFEQGLRIVPGSRTEDIVILLINVGAGVVGFVVSSVLQLGAELPRSVPLIAAVLATLLFTVGRAVWRWLTGRLRLGHTEKRPTLVYGSGFRAGALIVAMNNNPQPRALFAVGVLAETKDTTHGLVHGMRVKYVEPSRLSEYIRVKGIEAVVIATEQTLEPEVVAELKHAVEIGGAELLVFPELESGEHTAGEGRLIDRVRSLEVGDLINREVITLDEAAIGECFTGKTVLVTGAGGSIGSEICRQVYRYKPKAIIRVDRDEGGLHATQLSLTGTALFDGPNTILADIRDADVIRELMLERRPDVVIHAAALKHMPLLEIFPIEAVKTNVIGTQNVLEAAAAAEVPIVVNISTDKAANPTSVLGESKRIAERLTAHFSDTYPGTWVSVRFGNVFGSRGSVIETFSRQIEAGGPVTITAPGVNRFFMSIPEASQLVLQAATIGKSGETLVLEMGEPVLITELAQKIMSIYGKNVEIVYTGLRPGEKLSEELVDFSEHATVGDRHPMVTEVRVAPRELEPELLTFLDDEDAVRRWLAHVGETRRDSMESGQAESTEITSA